MAIRTKTLMIKIVETFNEFLSTFYEDAIATSSLYCVINNPVVSSLCDQGSDLVAFYVDIYNDDKSSDATEQLEDICEKLRNELNGEIIKDNNFGGHLNFEKQFSVQEAEFDINHRRQEWTARIFYV